MSDLGTVTLTEERPGSMARVIFDWLSNADGKATKTTAIAFDGKIECAAFIPDGAPTVPSDLYDVTVSDESGVDVLCGAGIDKSNAATQVTAAASLGAVASDKLTLSVTNAGVAKGGQVILYIR